MTTAVSGPPRRLIAALLATAVVCAGVAVLWWNSDRTTSSRAAPSVTPAPPTPLAETAVGRIAVDRDSAPVGTRLTVWLTDWPSGAITVRLCGNAAVRGSADCANTTAVSSHVRGPAPTAVVLVVAAPPVACPCVVQASDTATAARAAQPFAPTGLPELPQAPPAEPATAAAVEIADVRLVDERPWRERWSAWFGGSAHRTLVLTLRNPGPVPAAAPPLSLVVGRGDPPTTLVAAPDAGTLAPGEERTFHIGVTLGAPAYGTYQVQGQLGDSPSDSATYTGAPATSFVLRTSTTPWGLAAVAGLLLAWLLRPLLRRGRKPLRDAPWHVRGCRPSEQRRGAAMATATNADAPTALVHPELLERGHPFRQWKTWRIPGTELTLTGYSRANDKTFFHIPELRCSLDAGLCEGRQVDTVFLTHTHHDHAKDLDFLAAKDGGVDIHLPAAAEPYVEAYLWAGAELNHGAAFDPELAGHRLHGVRQDDEFTFGRTGHHVRVVECEHKVPCVGYAFSEHRKALRPEFEELRRALVAEGRGAEFGRMMAERRKQGVEVDELVRRPLFAFLGDTHVSVFARNPWLFDYPVVITECTFLDDAELDRAERIGHTVWSSLRPVVAAHPETLFVLTHFSLRHSDREVVAFFQRQFEDADQNMPRNVVVWAHPDSSLPEQHQHQRRDV